MIWCTLVGGEEGHNGSNVGGGRNGKPVSRSSDGLVGVLEFLEAMVVRVRIRYGVNGAAEEVWSYKRNLVTVFEF